MGTRIRPELSDNNEYYVGRERYYELKHFCLQYPLWKKGLSTIDGMSRQPTVMDSPMGYHRSDPTAKCAEKRAFYSERMDMVERTVMDTDHSLAEYILKAVTEGYSYVDLKSLYDIPCGRDVYYKMYRKFFWLLNMVRK